MRTISVLFFASIALACSGGSGTGGSGSGSARTVGACDQVRNHVRSLYEAEKHDDKVNAETRGDLVNANVHMVISDCERNPKSFVGCIEAARTIESLESSCLIPLDEEGSVEGQQFR